MSAPVLLDVSGHVATITLNRPDALNAMDVPMAHLFTRHLLEVEANEAVRVLILAGAGRAFLAGGDINTMVGLSSRPAQDRRREFEAIVQAFNPATIIMRRMPQPIIAKVQGVAAGYGVTLIMASDLAVATEDASLSLAYSRIGTTPDGGSTWLLPRLVGAKRAAEIAFFGDKIDAATALSLGFFNRTVPRSELDAAADELASRLASGPSKAYAGIKKLLRLSADNSLETQLQAEAESFAACSGTADFAEAVNAFMEKRKPVFQGA
jgi:2-(1,2-epoxy-1,2-dihydrophenyl)acetyl-CoA isomerase